MKFHCVKSSHETFRTLLPIICSILGVCIQLLTVYKLCLQFHICRVTVIGPVVCYAPSPYLLWSLTVICDEKYSILGKSGSFYIIEMQS